jgi:predicted transcriptional regulator
MNLVTLTARWTKQLSVTHASGTDDKPAAAIALGCDVIKNDKLMYVAGVVENGATIDYGKKTSSAGGMTSSWHSL